MTPDAERIASASARNILVLTGGLAFLLIWATVACFRTAHRPLSSLERVAGPLRSAALRRTTGKNAHDYLTFSLVNHAQTFTITEYNSRQPLADLQQALVQQQQAQPGTALIVYYDAPAWWTDGTYFQVYQLELPYEVIYSIDEIRQRALGQAALALLALSISSLVGLSQYLAHRASAENPL